LALTGSGLGRMPMRASSFVEPTERLCRRQANRIESRLVSGNCKEFVNSSAMPVATAGITHFSDPVARVNVPGCIPSLSTAPRPPARWVTATARISQKQALDFRFHFAFRLRFPPFSHAGRGVHAHLHNQNPPDGHFAFVQCTGGLESRAMKRGKEFRDPKARLKLDTSPNPQSSTISNTVFRSAESRVATSRSRARRTYWCGVTPVSCSNIRRK